jgi:hypothetical protein
MVSPATSAGVVPGTFPSATPTVPAPVVSAVPPTPVKKSINSTHISELRQFLFPIFGIEGDVVIWSKAKNARLSLDRYHAMNRFYQILDQKKWSSASGGYRIPISKSFHFYLSF